ncbi:DUF4942 domain-containing protein [Edwardsiella hoshinae]|nr:DUF4942 domain-containing protein [Edwardsiella hoshinae]
MQQITELSRLTQSLSADTAERWGMTPGNRYECWLLHPPETAIPTMIRNIDRKIWNELMTRSGMLALMDAQARDEWLRNLESHGFPEGSAANIHATFKQLFEDREEMFERGVINIFRSLSWDYRTNNLCYFGKKIIVNTLVRYDQWGFHFSRGPRSHQLVDLVRRLHLLDGNPVPDNRADIASRFDEHISRYGKTAKDNNDAYLLIRYFQKGSAHITFKHPDLTEKMNGIIAKHYPGMLPSQQQ